MSLPGNNVRSNTVHPSSEVDTITVKPDRGSEIGNVDGATTLTITNAFECDPSSSPIEIPEQEITTQETTFDRTLQYNGMQPLMDLEGVIVKRIVRAPERMAQAEPSKYEISTTTGDVIFFAAERTEFFVKTTALFTKPTNIEISIMSTTGENVLNMEIERGFHEYKWCLTLRQKDKIIGKVSQKVGCLTPYYLLQDSQSNELMTVKIQDRTEDLCICPLTRPAGCFASNYNILLPSGFHSVGTLRKQFTTPKLNNQYDINFSHSLEAGVKSLLIATAIMMDLEVLSGIRGRGSRRNMDVKHFCFQFCFSVWCLMIPTMIIIFIIGKLLL